MTIFQSKQKSHRVVENDLSHVQRIGLDVSGWIPDVRGEGGKINPHLTRFVSDDQYVDVLHIKPIYYENRAGHWRPMEEICSYHGNTRIELNDNWRLAHPRFIKWLTSRQRLFGKELLLPTPFGFIPSAYQDYVRPTVNVGLTTTTEYPNAGAGTAPMDATTQSDRVIDTWDVAHDDTVGTAFQSTYNTAVDMQARIRTEITSNDWHSLYRASTGFDTSAVSSDTISSAVYSLYVLSVDNDFSGGEVGVDFHSPNSESTLVRTDYINARWASVDQATRKTIAGLSTSAYMDFTLNATGEGNINTSGNTYFGIRIGRDIDDSAPTWAATSNSRVTMSSADETGTGQDPVIVIIHSAGGGPATFRPKVMMF